MPDNVFCLDNRINLPREMTVDFYVLDVETANQNAGSICQIGIAAFSRQKLTASCSIMINPECGFSAENISIHGITEATVADKPRFNEVWPQLAEQLANNYLFHHTSFDNKAIQSACMRYELPFSQSIKWIDSASLARAVWPDVRKRGFGLANLCKRLGIEFKHHDAEQDAIATGKMVINALNQQIFDIEYWNNLFNKKN